MKSDDGVQYTVESFPGLYEKNLKGECLAAFKEDELWSDWNVDGEKFKGKMDLITSFQADCLEMWAFSYWRGGGTDPNTPKSDSDLEKHIKVLLLIDTVSKRTALRSIPNSKPNLFDCSVPSIRGRVRIVEYQIDMPVRFG